MQGHEEKVDDDKCRGKLLFLRIQIKMGQFKNQSLQLHLSHPDRFSKHSTQQLSQTFHQPSGREHPLVSCFQKGCCLHLVMFIKMAAVSYLNVNYCYDTQDNLTCFSNLFFLVIRCSNWKIFQSVTTVPKVKWQGEGAFPQDLNYKSGAGCSMGSHWTNQARNQRGSFWNQAGGTHDLQELDDSRGRQSPSRWLELPCD